MQVTILQNCAVRGRSYKAGSVAEFPDDTAKELIQIGRAEKADGKKPGKG